MRRSNILSYLFILGIFLAACQKDNLQITEDPKETPFVTKWEVTINGLVTDKNNNALEFATVSVDDINVETDALGRFSITGLVNSQKASVKVSKNGYFDNYPVFYPEKDQAQEVRIQLSERLLAGSVNSANSTIDYNDHKIEFGTSKFTTENGSPYNGEVNVFVDYLDPTDSNLSQFMPGDLVGINTDDEEQILESYGMLNVEMEDENGNPLQIDGEATLKMQVPADLVGAAPATIPLWYFDETSGNWIEEGIATLEGNTYVGTVSHFTFWNCDAPFDLVTINGIVNSTADPTTLTVKVTRENGSSGTVIPNERGYFEGKVPKDEVLSFDILNPCGGSIYSDEIGGYSDDTNIGVFNVDSGTIVVTISGTAVNCDMNPLQEGYVAVYSDGGNGQILPVADGSFSGTIVLCAEEALTVIVYDLEEYKASEEIEFPFSTNITTGEISSCSTNITPPGIYISGDDVNTYMPSTSGINAEVDSFLYNIQVVEDQGTGSVIYDASILNWTADPDNPEFFLSWTAELIGDPLGITQIDELGTPVLMEINHDPGSIFDLIFEDCTISIATISGTTVIFEDHTVRIVGIVN